MYKSQIKTKITDRAERRLNLSPIYLFVILPTVDPDISLVSSNLGTGNTLGYEFPIAILVFFAVSLFVVYFLFNGDALVRIALFVDKMSAKIASFFSLPYEKKEDMARTFFHHREVISAVKNKKALREFLKDEFFSNLEKEKEDFEIFPDPNADYYDDKKNIKKEDIGHKTPFSYLVEMDIQKGETLKSVKYDKYNPDKEKEFIVDLDKDLLGEEYKLDIIENVFNPVGKTTSQNISQDKEEMTSKIPEDIESVTEENTDIPSEEETEVIQEVILPEQVIFEEEAEEEEMVMESEEIVQEKNIPEAVEAAIEIKKPEITIEHGIGKLPKKNHNAQISIPADSIQSITVELERFSSNEKVRFDDMGIKLVILAGEMKKDISLRIMQHIIKVGESWGYSKDEVFGEKKVREILFATYLTMIPVFIRWVIEGESEKVFALIKSLKQQDHSLKEYIVQVVYEFDAGFRFLTEAGGNPDSQTVAILESTDRRHAEDVLSSLVSGLDETYKDEYSSIKLALMRAMGAGRGKRVAVSF